MAGAQHRFEVAGRRLALFQRRGESFEHVLMKALCFGLYADRFPDLEVERNLGGRYTPDLVSVDAEGRPRFWGECGSVSMRKVVWLAKHSGAGELAFVKIAGGTGFATEVRDAVEERYRPPGRLAVYGFREDVARIVREADLRIGAVVPPDWYRRVEV